MATGTEDRPTSVTKQRRRRRRRRLGNPKGVASFWARLRRRVWAWWVWVLLAIAAANWRHWTVFAIFLVVAFVALVFAPPEQPPTYGLDHDFPIDSDEFLNTIAGVTNAPFSIGNRVEILNNGDEFYPRMLEDIKSARHSITMEAYIYWAGDVGSQFADALAAKSREGLTVKLLLDAVGSSNISDDILDRLTSGGCKIAWYHPVHWYTIRRVNNRTHRKSLIIDGRVGYTGGAGIADHWLGHAEDEHHWRDVQVRIEGPAVIALQSGFAQNWLETTNELVTGNDYYPTPDDGGTLAVQSILSSPESGSSSVRTLYYLSIVGARKSIFIATPYFIPDEAAVETLVDAKKRGVDVRVIVSGAHNDNFLAFYNSSATYGDLLAAGVTMFSYNRTMLHHKVMIVDGIWSTVGTTNFDNRSFALNDENNVCVYDRAFAAELERDFANDCAASQVITYDAWKGRGLYTKTMELVATLLKEQV